MKKPILMALAAGAVILGSGTAQAARVDWSVSVGTPIAAAYPVAYPSGYPVGAPVAYPAYAGYPAYQAVRPVAPPVVYVPAPRVLVRPSYYAPYPVYSRPWPVVYPRYYDRDHYRGGYDRGDHGGWHHGDRDHDGHR